MEKETKKFNIIGPEQAFEKFLKWFDNKKRIAFLITLLAGIITHITMITETIMSQDGLWNSMEYFRPGDWEMTLGRWGIALIERLNFFIAIPSISTVSCILAMAVTAVLLVDIFEFKNKISVIATSLILVLTPTLTVTLLYVYTAVAYSVNLLIATLVIWFLYKFKNKKLGFIFAILCFMLSLSIYQSYIGVSIGLCIMVSILDLIKNEKNIKQIFKNIGITILAVIIGGILYYVVTLGILHINNLEISNYKGYQDGMTITSILSNLKDSIYNAYEDFFMFFLGNGIIYNTNYRRELFNGLFLIAFGLLSIISIFTIKGESKKEKIIKGLLLLLFILLIPLGLNIIDVLIVGNDMYALTAVQIILMIPFAFAMMENINKFEIIKWVAIISCIYALATYYIAINTSYAALKLTYNQAYSTTMRILDRVENTQGYSKDYPILFAGIVGNNNYPRTSSLYTYTVGSVVNNPTFHGSYSGAIGTWFKFLRVFYGIDIAMCAPESYYKIVTGEEYKNMEIFPSQNSVRVIDGIIVVKLSDEPPLPY